MAKHIPCKVGDRVRATFGGSVVTGVLTYKTDDLSCLTIKNRSWSSQLQGPWYVEVLATPIPEVRGAALCDKDNDVWAWDEAYGLWARAIDDVTSDQESLIENYGPVTELTKVGNAKITKDNLPKEVVEMKDKPTSGSFQCSEDQKLYRTFNLDEHEHGDFRKEVLLECPTCAPTFSVEICNCDKCVLSK